MTAVLEHHLTDPFLARLFADVRRAGALRSISLDITHICNLRCQGCWFFAEDLDRHRAPKDEASFDAFIASELARGTNYITVTGGEPALMVSRIRKLHRAFQIIVVTNGTRRIPMDGLETLPIGVSVWGDHPTDTALRGRGKIDVFARGLRSYRDDPRAVFYYTTTPGNAHEIPGVVEEIVANGNRLMFNFYGDVSGLAGALDSRQGFGRVREEIDRAIDRYPDRILMTSYLSEVISTGQLYGERWGYDVCSNVTVDHPVNAARIENGHRYNPHFRAYNPDLQTTRRCCVGDERDCSTCFNVWSHMGWVLVNLERHLGSRAEFTCWLTSTWMFYLMNRLVDFEAGVALLPEVHRRVRAAMQQLPEAARPDLSTARSLR